MILAAPELDTEHVLARYAAHHDHAPTQQAWCWLLRRTAIKCTYDALKAGGSDLSELYERVALGAVSRTDTHDQQQDAARVATTADLENMSQDELKQFYIDACKSVGVDIDPSTFLKTNERSE